MTRVPLAELKARRAALRSALDRARTACAFMTSDAAVHYYSGFTGSESAALMVRGRIHLITDFRYREEAETTATGCAVHVRTGETLAELAGGIMRKAGVRSVAIEERTLSVRAADDLKRAAPRCRQVPSETLLRGPREVKSAWEIARITAALRIAEAAYTDTMGLLQKGMTEMDIARELEYRMLCRGASARAFPTIAAIGPTASLPHAHPGKRKLTGGSLLLIDWGACLARYNSDLTRVVFVDSIPQLWRERYCRVLEAQHAACKEIRTGVQASVPDAAARAVLARHGLDRLFGHALGHAVGLEIHESPAFSTRCSTVLKSGMVMTVEPGVYLPGAGGIRIEDMAVVTPRGCRILSRLPTDPDSAVV